MKFYRIHLENFPACGASLVLMDNGANSDNKPLPDIDISDDDFFGCPCEDSLREWFLGDELALCDAMAVVSIWNVENIRECNGGKQCVTSWQSLEGEPFQTIPAEDFFL